MTSDLWDQPHVVGMESALARVKFTGISAGGGDEDAVSELEGSEEEEEERETRKLVAQQNRKGRKSGGFQSMGERRRGPVGGPRDRHLMRERRWRLSIGLVATTHRSE